MQSKIESGVSRVHSSEEYARFIEAHKTPPPPPVQFAFDAALLEAHPAAANAASSRLAADAVVLDDLTIDSLRQRLADNEARLQECRAGIKVRSMYAVQGHDHIMTEIATPTNP